MLNVNFEEHSGDWFFFYAGYSFNEKRAYAYVSAADNEYKSHAEAHHIIPKFVGLYLGANFQGGLKDASVCVSGEDDNCVTDDFNELMNN